MDLLFSLFFLALCLSGLAFAIRDWRITRSRSLLLLSIAFLLLVPIGLWDLVLASINIPTNDRLGYKVATLTLCVFVYLRHYIGGKPQEVDEQE